MSTYLQPRAATVASIATSAFPPLTSLTIVAPASTAFLAVSADIVSMLISAPFPARAFTTGSVRACSTSDVIRSAPGRVDSPPISITFTPSAIISSPRVIAWSTERYFPPSANESGVTLSIPITIMLLPICN